MQVHLERFFHRYDLSCESPDLRFLSRLANAYSNLPYENVTKILKDTKSSRSLEKLRRTDEVLEDHLRWNTGGTCFSLCNALQEILQLCGFNATIAMADMHYGKNIHCAIIVNTGGTRYLLDPGYLLHDPIVLPHIQVIHQTSMNTVVLQNEGEERYSLFTQENGVQRWRYRLHALPVSQAEFESHWLRSFSLNSMEHVTLTRLNEYGRIYYRKDRLDVVGAQERTRQKLSIGEPDLLSHLFGLPSDLILQAQKVVGGS